MKRWDSWLLALAVLVLGVGRGCMLGCFGRMYGRSFSHQTSLRQVGGYENCLFVRSWA